MRQVLVKNMMEIEYIGLKRRLFSVIMSLLPIARSTYAYRTLRDNPQQRNTYFFEEISKSRLITCEFKLHGSHYSEFD